MAPTRKNQQRVKKSTSKKSARKARVKTRAGKCTHWIESEDRTCRNPLNPANKKYCTAHLDELARRVTMKLSPLEATALTLFRKYDLTEAIYDETSRLVESFLHDAAVSRHPSTAEVNAWKASQAFRPVMDKLTKSMEKLNTHKY
ncbi:uncharacterized protein PITG_04728 [Phytophthora infestans T30-4]|uniref:Uncharacterized protein n=2 Tax=Phytophthora infestans TaxID=4787 RepID=D0N1X0_PHYIT|nr:uncharacterized protein PITG_04728 [Phytophthora infestans T30-4]EEY68299.1 conserved hypothetical protein [Phytophthora infestans T30-4]KAF4037897.1 hypothetical protein GN244_ATG10024 [Phytophthora infestans]KAI9994945.1 hypothetical protein PInf_011825 [Phytophthora infestans]|eukprot:XP_002905458.1 conserved hypothetical protein [Phytophthora infestans T30-4]